MVTWGLYNAKCASSKLALRNDPHGSIDKAVILPISCSTGMMDATHFHGVSRQYEEATC